MAATITTHNLNKLLITNSLKNPPSSSSSSSSNRSSLQPISQPSKPVSLGVATTTVVSTLTLTHSPLAIAAKKIAESPQADNRSLALLLPIIPAVGWVLYNIAGPALNQLNRMRSEKGLVLGAGLSGGLFAASSAVYVPSASAAMSEVVESGGGDNSQGLLVLFVAAAAFLEVLLLSTYMKPESEEKTARD